LLNPPSLATVALTGNYADLLGIPNLAAVYAENSFANNAQNCVMVANAWSTPPTPQTVTIPSSGTYLVIGNARLFGLPNGLWGARLVNQNAVVLVDGIGLGFITGGMADGQGDTQVPLFWVGQLSSGDVISIQYTWLTNTTGSATLVCGGGPNGQVTLHAIRLGN